MFSLVWDTKGDVLSSVFPKTEGRRAICGNFISMIVASAPLKPALIFEIPSFQIVPFNNEIGKCQIGGVSKHLA